VKVGDLVKSIIAASSVHTQRLFLVTEKRIAACDGDSWIKLLIDGDSVGWLREDEWEIVNASR